MKNSVCFIGHRKTMETEKTKVILMKAMKNIFCGPISIQQTAKNQTGINNAFLVRRKTIIVRMRSDRIVKTVNVSKNTVIEFT